MLSIGPGGGGFKLEFHRLTSSPGPIQQSNYRDWSLITDLIASGNISLCMRLCTILCTCLHDFKLVPTELLGIAFRHTSPSRHGCIQLSLNLHLNAKMTHRALVAAAGPRRYPWDLPVPGSVCGNPRIRFGQCSSFQCPGFSAQASNYFYREPRTFQSVLGLD